MLALLAGILFLLTFYYCLLKPLNFWRSLGIQSLPIPYFFYCNWLAFLKKKSNATFVMELYNKVDKVRYFGLHQFNRPAMMLRDPELIKQIAIKDFDHFTEHKFILSKDIDPFFGKMLFSLKGQEWREVRAVLSPSFTSGKMRQLFHLISECSEKFVQFFQEKKDGVIVVEMQDTFTRFCNDVIASSVFGVEVDSLRQPENEFYLKGRDLTNLTSFKKSFKFMGAIAFPKLYKFLNLKFFDQGVMEFFTHIVDDSIKQREEKGIVRPDMIHLLMEARKGADKDEEDVADAGFATVKEVHTGKVSKNITNEDILAHTVGFFFGGFESVSRLMCFMAHELAVNQDIQQRLREEISRTKEKCKGKLTYEGLMGMRFMDMVVSEVLRKYPTQVATDRLCTKPYTIEASTPDELPVQIPEGMTLFLPSYALHHDPEYFPEPEKFDPERFSDENKGDIRSCSYQPFGVGPRSCIASRFALLETKAAFFYVLEKFEIVPVEKTRIPLVLLKSMMSLSAEGGFWLGLKPVE